MRKVVRAIIEIYYPIALLKLIASSLMHASHYRRVYLCDSILDRLLYSLDILVQGNDFWKKVDYYRAFFSKLYNFFYLAPDCFFVLDQFNTKPISLLPDLLNLDI